jgi:hypothetical protein
MACKILNVNEMAVDKKMLISISKIFIVDLGRYLGKVKEQWLNKVKDT